ncbi:MAG: hypothetical protein FGM32_00370 [Candidatus Kapabacteria bacterium]|nr:hypothetical protein [Candidatus Kapabacteria bacterium]
MTIRSAVLAMLVAAGVACFAQPDTALSRFNIGGDLSVGPNLHASNFSVVKQGVPSCCATFTSGVGLGLSIGATVAYDLDADLNAEPLRLGARLSWNSLSGDLSEEEFISHVITGSTVQKGMALHTVAASYSLLGIEPFLSARPIPSIPLRMRVGTMIGLPVGASFSQREELVSPTDPNLKYSNGERVRNAYEGDLPDVTTQFLASVALSWPITTTSGLEVSPELSVALPLTNLTSSLQWTITPVRAGVSVRYGIPKSVPAPPPPPPLPAPPAARIPMISSKIEFASSADTIVVPMVQKRIRKNVVDVPAVLFFEPNSTIPLAGRNDAERLQQRTIEAIRDRMDSDPSLRLTVIGSAAADEDPVMARERFAWAVRRLGIDVSRISMKKETPPAPEEPQLLEEQRNVTFLINGRSEVLTATESITEQTNVTGYVPFAHVVTCDTTCEQQISATVRGKPVQVAGTGPALKVVIEPSMLADGAELLNIRSTVSVGDRQVSDVQERFVIAGVRDSTVTIGKVAFTDIQDGDVRTLCYFDFNSSVPRTVSDRDVDAVRAAILAGSAVSFVASTDNLGTEESNRNLAKKRAAAVAELLGVDAQKISIVTKITSGADNATPMSRISNRSVRAVLPRQR